MSTEVEAPPSGRPAITTPAPPARRKKSPYPYWFCLPAAVIFLVFFVVPTFSSFFFSLTRWDLSTWEFIGLDNYVAFFQESALITGLINKSLALVGINGPAWLVDPKFALLSVALVDVWKGVGLATVIFIAGIVSIPREYFEASATDGASAVQRFWKIILPLSRPAITTVIILALIGGLRSFDLIWAMTRGGPGFTSDVIASVIYKQYQAGFYGLSTAGNVVLFLVVTAIVFPLFRFLTSREVDQ